MTIDDDELLVKFNDWWNKFGEEKARYELIERRSDWRDAMQNMALAAFEAGIGAKLG